MINILKAGKHVAGSTLKSKVNKDDYSANVAVTCQQLYRCSSKETRVATSRGYIDGLLGYR